MQRTKSLSPNFPFIPPPPLKKKRIPSKLNKNDIKMYECLNPFLFHDLGTFQY